MENPALQKFHDKVAEDHLVPLWVAAPHLMPMQPKTSVIPYLWKSELLTSRLMEAGKLITPDQGGDTARRVLILENPGLVEIGVKGSTTHTLTTALQLIFPGEVAPAHRHSQTAFRFILSGEGAYTTVQGERVYMKEGDFLLTEQYCWHEHGHEGDGPMIWLDGLDIPFVRMMNATFFEPHPNQTQEVTVPLNYSNRKYADGMVRPIGDRRKRDYPSPLSAYPWNKTATSLDSLAELGEADPFDGIAIEYINPANGGPANTNIGNRAQMLRPREHTKAHRHVHSSVYVVYQGSGYTVINGERFDWSKGDIFVVPTWAVHEHANTSEAEPALLFSMNDQPLFEKLNLEVEQAYEENEGHQQVTKVFTPRL
jgi:gentisate 1,2-dioxygenase